MESESGERAKISQIMFDYYGIGSTSVSGSQDGEERRRNV